SYLSLFLALLFHATATTEIYTLSLHDALPIFGREDVAEPTDGVHHGGITHEAGSVRAIDHGLDGAVMDQQRLLSPVQLEQEREGARFTQRVERAPGDR